MNIADAIRIKEKFLSKAPAEYYYHHAEQLNSIGISLFDRIKSGSRKIASIDILSIEDTGRVTIWIGDNQYFFIDNPELCIELIERFLPNIYEQLVFNVGDKVHYVPFEGCHEGLYENGIVKTIRDDTQSHVFVVYSCNKDWENYANYTGVSTRKSQLRLGWANVKDEQ